MEYSEGNFRARLRTLKPFLDDYLTLAFREWDSLSWETTRTGVFMGCGPFPMTALSFCLFSLARTCGLETGLRRLLSERSPDYNPSVAFDLLTDLPINRLPPVTFHCIDSNESAIQSAQEILSSLGIGQLTTFQCLNGVDYQACDPIDFIHIAIMVSPKEPVIRHLLRETARRPQRGAVLVRFVYPDDMRSLLYEPLSHEVISTLVNEFPHVREARIIDASTSNHCKTSLLLISYDRVERNTPYVTVHSECSALSSLQ